MCVHSELPVVSFPSPGMGVLQILQDALCQIQYWGKKWEIWEWNGKYRGTTESAIATSLT